MALRVSDKIHHARLRRTIAPSFNDASLSELEITVRKHCDEFIKAVTWMAAEVDGGATAGGGGIIDMNEWFNRLSYDLAGTLSFGQSFGALRGGPPHFFIELLRDWSSVLSLVYSPLLSPLRFVCLHFGQLMGKARVCSLAIGIFQPLPLADNNEGNEI